MGVLPWLIKNDTKRQGCVCNARILLRQGARCVLLVLKNSEKGILLVKELSAQFVAKWDITEELVLERLLPSEG